MANTLILGHKNPDTDSICSAIAYAHLKQALGASVEAVRLGDINAETKYALETFGVTAPRLVETISNEVKEAMLVDHNERQQSASDIDQVQVVEVIDHHRIANFETSNPLYYRAEPVGCTATILNKMYKENGVAIPKDVAGLMVSAIVSDTLLLKSPTCTPQDEAAVKELATIAGVDLQDYGLKMLKAGADLSDTPIPNLIRLDAKEFPMGDYKVEIAQVNAVDVNDVLSRKAELATVLQQAVEQKQLDLFLFVVTDILNSDSVGVAYGRMTEAVEKAFGVKLQDSEAVLKGVVSRKKQIVPVLTDTLATWK